VIASLETDVLVLGAGGAGLTAALHAADASPALRVTVVVKGLLGRAGCTRMVQGGYNAVLTEPDSLDAHLLDTLAGGGWINDQELVWTLVTEAPGPRARAGVALRLPVRPHAGGPHPPEAVRGPEPRPHHPQGRPHRHRDHEPAHRAGAGAPEHRALEECRAVELLRDEAGRAAGALLLDMRAGTFVAARAKATLLAMGGGPTMYRVIACSADKSADGIALAYPAGSRCATWRWCSSIPPAW
jgi:succinate dehydrogenase/fumarate reductase flavoprotein subunit